MRGGSHGVKKEDDGCVACVRDDDLIGGGGVGILVGGFEGGERSAEWAPVLVDRAAGSVGGGRVGAIAG